MAEKHWRRALVAIVSCSCWPILFVAAEEPGRQRLPPPFKADRYVSIGMTTYTAQIMTRKKASTVENYHPISIRKYLQLRGMRLDFTEDLLQAIAFERELGTTMPLTPFDKAVFNPPPNVRLGMSRTSLRSALEAWAEELLKTGARRLECKEMKTGNKLKELVEGTFSACYLDLRDSFEVGPCFRDETFGDHCVAKASWDFWFDTGKNNRLDSVYVQDGSLGKQFLMQLK